MGSRERYVAFLKGINVGGHTVKMDHLRLLFGEVEPGGAHLESIQTYIASGNVIFDFPSADPRTIEVAVASHLEKTLGYEVPTFIRTVDTIARIAAFDPFADVDGGASLYIAFLPGQLDSARATSVESASTDTDRFRIDDSELYWQCLTRFSDSPFSGPALEKLLGTTVTIRNSNTVKKIADRFGA